MKLPDELKMRNLFELNEQAQRERQREIMDKYRKQIEAAILAAKAEDGTHSVYSEDGAEAYAYSKGDRIAWGVNAPEGGFNMLRGIRTPQGTDEAIM